MQQNTKPLSTPIGHDTIDCGIGKISYTTHNLQLKLLMEELEKAIIERGTGIVLQHIQALNKK